MLMFSTRILAEAFVDEEIPLTPRREPKQARSRATVDAIEEACAQLLVEDGFARLSTNRIAERAGVSIGSLYQYFPNKEAVVTAVLEDFIEDQFRRLTERVAEFADAPLEEVVRELIDAVLDTRRVEPKFTQVLFELVMQFDDGTKYNEWTQRFEVLIREAMRARDDFEPEEVEIQAFVIVTAVDGVIHHAMLNRLEWVEPGRIGEELTELVLAYLR
jgi:AcrR family transcriptional regulator